MADDTFEFDPNTGLPKRVKASDRRRVQVPAEKEVEPTRSKGGKAPAKKAPKKAEAKRTKTGGVQAAPATTGGSAAPLQITVSELPGGGSVALMNIEEIDFFEKLKQRYTDEYPLTKPNDLSRLSQLLMMELTAHRLIKKAGGQSAKYDAAGQLVGIEVYEPAEVEHAMINLPKVQDEIRKLEVSLRIDKKTREGSSQHEVRNYIETLKRAAHEKGIHLSERYTYYDETFNELSWMLRVFDNADEQDRAYHNISSDSILAYMRERLGKKEEMDKEFAKEKQSLWVGKI